MTTNGLRLEWAQQTELMGQQLSLGLKAVGTPDHAGVVHALRDGVNWRTPLKAFRGEERI